MTERQWGCVRCLTEGRAGVPAVALDGLNSVCLEHLVAAWAHEFSHNNINGTEHE